MPHHRLWWGGPIRPLYAGFDGLDVAFQGCVSDRLLALLVDARAEAEAINGPVTRELNGLRFTIAPSGARNGFRYRLDTGDEGEVWLIKHSSDASQWNLFVSVKSFALLTHHYAGMKQRVLEERLAQIEATIRDVRPNRIDFACDLDAPGFEPEPDCFVAPGRTRARNYYPGDGARLEDRATLSIAGGVVEVHRLARRVNGITVGRMPGRQLCLYDKRADSLVKRKLYWAAVWGLDLAERRDPVWRVEVRAAKRELKKRWRVRSLPDLEGRLPDIVRWTLANVRYVIFSPGDSNAARWPTHPLWQAAEGFMVEAIEAHAFAPAPPRNDLPTPRLIKLDEFRRQLIGLAAGYAGLAGLTEDRAGELPGLVAATIRDYARDRPGLLEEKLAQARARHGVFGSAKARG
jgi:hypothetical protein